MSEGVNLTALSLGIPLAAHFAVLIGCTATPQADSTPAPLGRLGHRLGTYLHIEGIRSEQSKSGSSTLIVDRVNGAECNPPVHIWLDNLSLPTSEHCAISGYESGRWIGLPPAVREAEGLPERQAAWQFQVYFVVTSVQEPSTLRDAFATHRP